MTKIKTVQRISDILNLYSVRNPEMRAVDVARSLNLNQNTIRGLMASLGSVNILQQSAVSKKYRLGGRVLELAKILIATLDLKAIALPHLRKLYEETGEEVTVNVRREDRRFRLSYIESSGSVRHVVDPEESYGPLHAGAPGKLLLSGLSDEEIEDVLARTGIPRYTKNTITDRKKLQEKIENIRQSGFAVSKGESISGLFSVSAPVRDHLGEVIAALTITTLLNNYSPKLEGKYKKLLGKRAEEMSRELGYGPVVSTLISSATTDRNARVT